MLASSTSTHRCCRATAVRADSPAVMAGETLTGARSCEGSSARRRTHDFDGDPPVGAPNEAGSSAISRDRRCLLVGTADAIAEGRASERRRMRARRPTRTTRQKRRHHRLVAWRSSFTSDSASSVAARIFRSAGERTILCCRRLNGTAGRRAEPGTVLDAHGDQFRFKRWGVLRLLMRSARGVALSRLVIFSQAGAFSLAPGS